MESFVIFTLYILLSATWAGEIQCDGEVDGNLEASYDTASYDFFNPVSGLVTITNCASDFDTQMRIYDKNDIEITSRSNNLCDGDDCYDSRFPCSTPLRETITYGNLAAGTYTIKIKPWGSGGNFVIKTFCANANAIPDVYNDIVGSYNAWGESGEHRISRTTGNQIKVDMSPRPIATGWYNPPIASGGYGYGHVNFPDDRTYSLYFYPGEGIIYWDGPRGRTANFWMEQDIIGCYGPTGIFRNVVDTDQIRVDMTAFGRPLAYGTYEKDTQDGSVVFTDDKVYDFQFDTTIGQIDWGLQANLADNNMWVKTQPDIVGIYGDPLRAAVIYRTQDNIIKVDMSSAGRPTASGVVNCPQRGADPNIFTGYVIFPDDRKYNLWFNRLQGIIYWDHSQGSNRWQKFGDRDVHGAHSGPFNINLDWQDPKANDGFKIVTNANGYIMFEILAGLVLVLIAVNLVCCYAKYCYKNNKGYKVVKYDTDAEFVDSEANLMK